MSDPAAILKAIFKSKEYKELVKCAKKHCAVYDKLLTKEKALSDKIIKISDEVTKAKNMKDIVSKTKQMINISKELAKLNDNKEALTCAMSKCSNEFNNMTTFKTNAVVKQMEGYEAQMNKM